MLLRIINQSSDAIKQLYLIKDCFFSFGEMLGFYWNEEEEFLSIDFSSDNSRLTLDFESFLRRFFYAKIKKISEAIIYAIFWSLSASQVAHKFYMYIEDLEDELMKSSPVNEVSKDYLLYQLASLFKKNVNRCLIESYPIKDRQKNAFEFFDEEAKKYYNRLNSSKLFKEVNTEIFTLENIMSKCILSER